MKQKELSVWLRVVVILIGAAVLFLAAVFVPELGWELTAGSPELEDFYLPCLAFFWLTVLPVLAALVLAWLIFAEIGRDNSFCTANALRLRAISYLALADTLLYIFCALTLGFLHVLHPGFLTAFVCVIFMGLALTIGAAALSHLAQKAADMKAENDLVI